MFPSKTLVLLVLLSALVVACGPGSPAPVDALPGLSAWIDAPLDGSTIPQAAYNIVFSAASSNGAVEQFEIQINGIAEDSVAPMYESVEGDAKYYYSEYNWLPPAPGTYLIEVRAISGDEMGLYSQAEVMVDGVEVAVEPQPDEEPGEEEDHFLIGIPLQNSNCRLGCSATFFDIIDTLFEGEEYSPLSGGGGWLLFRGPVANQRCWVASSLVDLQYGGESISVDEANAMSLFSEGPSCPPLPTATLTPLPPTETPVPLPQCSDGIDNDGDGDIDMADGRCLSPDDDDEAN